MDHQAQDSTVQQNYTLQVDFSWKKFKALINETTTTSNAPQPAYYVAYKATKPHLTFKYAKDEAPFATGSLHAISINPDCQIHGSSVALRARKRFKTEYTYQSTAFSRDANPVTMSWTTESGLSKWDFICLDDQQMPVGKFSVNIWGVKSIGAIEFMGPKANFSDAQREEIIVTGVTLLYCMMLRMNSILSLFGAIFSKPGHEKHD